MQRMKVWSRGIRNYQAEEHKGPENIQAEEMLSPPLHYFVILYGLR